MLPFLEEGGQKCKKKDEQKTVLPLDFIEKKRVIKNGK